MSVATLKTVVICKMNFKKRKKKPHILMHVTTPTSHIYIYIWQKISSFTIHAHIPWRFLIGAELTSAKSYLFC